MAMQPGKEKVYELAAQWRARCLADDTSLLWPDEISWTKENITQLFQVFLDNIDAGSESFLNNLKHQIGTESEPIHRVAADAIAIYCLFPSKSTMGKAAKLKLVSEVASWQAGSPSSLEQSQEAFEEGIGSAGMYYLNAGRPWQFAYILNFARLVHSEGVDTDSREQLQEIADLALEGLPGNGTAARNAILHLLFPDFYERTASQNHKVAIANEFGVPGDPDDIDSKLYSIRQRLKLELGRNVFDFYESELRGRWDGVKPLPASTRRYWKIAPGSDANRWKRFESEDVIAIGWTGSPDLRKSNAVSEASLAAYLKSIPTFTEKNYAHTPAARQLWAFFQEMSIGDGVLAYGAGKIRGFGRITGSYDFALNEDGYSHIRECAWDSTTPVGLSGLPVELVSKIQQNTTIVELTSSEFAKLTGGSESLNQSFDELAKRSNLRHELLADIETLLRIKKQIIFEGPPGVGKTYVARLFARYLAGVGLDDAESDRVEIVQFHQSYGYEDFVAGIRPVTSESGQLTYRSQPGIFLEMCERAAARPDETFVLIIDEINRGNLSRIFGELLYGLEYRDQSVRLQTPVEMGDRIDPAPAHSGQSLSDRHDELDRPVAGDDRLCVAPPFLLLAVDAD